MEQRCIDSSLDLFPNKVSVYKIQIIPPAHPGKRLGAQAKAPARGVARRTPGAWIPTRGGQRTFGDSVRITGWRPTIGGARHWSWCRKRAHAQPVLEPAKEQFDLPTVAIEFRDQGGAHGINGGIQFDRVRLVPIEGPDPGHQFLGQSRQGTPIPFLIGSGQRAAGDPGPEAHVVSQTRLRFEARLDVTQAFPKGHLGESQRQKMIPRRQRTAPDRRRRMSGMQTLELPMGEPSHDLGEDGFAGVHPGIRPKTGSGVQIVSTPETRLASTPQKLMKSSLQIRGTALGSPPPP